MTLRTARLVLRPWRADDFEPFAELNADPRVMEFFPQPLERSVSDTQAAGIQARIERDGYGLWAAELSECGTFIGFIGLNAVPPDVPFAPALEVGWRLAFPAWGRGLATEGARAALCFAHEQLGAPEVVSMTAVLNVRSRRVMEKLGMRRDPSGDFAHPRLPPGHRLSPHVLYRHRDDA